MLFGVAVSAAPSASAQEAGVNVNFPMGATFQDLTEANAQISSLAETDCSLGSPRFAFGLDADGDGAGDGYVFGYIGDAPSFTAWNLTFRRYGNVQPMSSYGRGLSAGYHCTPISDSIIGLYG